MISTEYPQVPGTQKAQPPSTTKLTRYDLINKNYIFPQEKYAIESSYTANYYDNSKDRVRTEKVIYPQNQVLPTGKFDSHSSYLQDYVGTQSAKRGPVRHEGQLKVGGKFEGQSNYIQSYANQGSSERREKVAFAENKIMPQGKFEAVSTYSGNYMNMPIQLLPRIKPSSELKVAGGALQGQSTYLTDYYNKEMGSKSQKIKFPDNEVMPRGQFQGSSTYDQTYLNNQSPGKNQPVKHQGELKIGGEFYGQSSYAQNYYDKGLGGRQERFQLPNNKVLPEGKFDEATTYGGNYVKTIIPRVQKFKPEGELKVAGGAFEGHSNYESDFIKKEGGTRSDRERIVQPQNEVLPKGNFVGSSTYADNYIQSQIAANHPFRLEGQLKVGGKFEGQSNYVENYFQKPITSRQQRATFAPNTFMPQGKFQTVSTYSGNYLNNPITSVPKIKPQGELKVYGGALQGQSTYLADYYNKENADRSQRVQLPFNEVMPKGRFEGNSTYENTYTGATGQRNPQFKPDNNLTVGEARFEGSSSYGVDYEGGKTEARYLSRQNDYLPKK